MIALLIAGSLSLLAYGQEGLRLPITDSAVVYHASTSEAGTQPGNFAVISEDGYRSFYSPRSAYREGPIAFEFWPPLRFELHPVLIHYGRTYAIATDRQLASYQVVSGKVPNVLESDTTPIRAENYRTVTFLVTRRAFDKEPWSAIMRTDVDRLGEPKSNVLWEFQSRSVSRAVLDRNDNGVLIQSLRKWYVCKGKSAPKKIDVPPGFDPWALDIKEGLLVGSLETQLVLLDSETGLVIRRIGAPTTPSGHKLMFFSATMLSNGRVIVCFYAPDAVSHEDRVSLYETSRTGRLTYLGPFDLQGSSPNGKVLMLGRGYENIARLVVWPRQ